MPANQFFFTRDEIHRAAQAAALNILRQLPVEIDMLVLEDAVSAIKNRRVREELLVSAK